MTPDEQLRETQHRAEVENAYLAQVETDLDKMLKLAISQGHRKVKAEAERDALQARVKVLETALRPFTHGVCTMEDIRRAQATLAPAESGEEPSE